jgi:aminoglycoside phosphotransferase (APT) family kinase protein
LAEKQGGKEMSDAPDWLRVVAVAHAADVDRWSEGHVAVQRVRGGLNNALYRVEVDGVRYACKLNVVDERHRAAREYGTLRLLQSAGLDIAPEPLCLDESCSRVPFPAVVYHWLPGVPLRTPLTADQQVALLDTFQRLHRLRPGDLKPGLRDAWFHWFDWEPYLKELGAFLKAYGAWLAATDREGPALQERLARLVERCKKSVRAAEVNPSRERVPLRLCRVDYNLANGVWGADGRLRWVDWEYSGWGDPALDLAELSWHAALAGFSAAQHQWLRDNYHRPEDNGPDRARLAPLTADSMELRARFVRLLERAQQLT